MALYPWNLFQDDERGDFSMKKMLAALLVLLLVVSVASTALAYALDRGNAFENSAMLAKGNGGGNRGGGGGHGPGDGTGNGGNGPKDGSGHGPGDGTNPVCPIIP
jgi:hypothetical protein